MIRDFGRHLLGITAVVFGVIAFVWPEPKHWQPVIQVGNVPLLEAILYLTAAAYITGGLMMQWRRTLGAGTASVASALLILTLVRVPGIIVAPRVYNSWGNVFEELSLLCAAVIVLAASAPEHQNWRMRAGKIAYYLFGLCVISFALEQAFYLKATADFVPTWIPPSPMFWAIATTVAFALAGLAILSGRCALLASQLLSAMVAAFGIIIWLPRLLSGAPALGTWSETATTFGVAASAWIVAMRVYDSRGMQR